MASWNNTSKNTSSYLNFLRRGKNTLLSEIDSHTFETVVTSDGKKLKELTFDQLSEQTWTNSSKSATPTFTNVTRN